jgi:pimeloyl-ACP methyl ester carboxylesterase
VNRAPLTLETWRSRGDSFNYRGQRIFTQAAGDPGAPAVLLIHGFPTASWDWSRVWPELAARFRLLAPDLLGFGFSAKPARYDYRISDQADLLGSFLAAQRIRSYHVLAHDYGDTVAQELLARAQENRGGPRLESVCFLNGGLFPEAHRPLLIQHLLASSLGPAIARLTSFRLFAANMRRIFGRGTQPSADELQAFWTLIRNNDGLRVMPRVIGYMRERRQHRARWVGALERCPVSLKLIVGCADPIAGAQLADRYRELVPRADVMELPGIGHYPQVEAPQAVLSAFLEFHARQVAQAGRQS